MKTIILSITSLTFLFFLLADTTITFNPIKVQFKSIYWAIGFIIIIISVVISSVFFYKQGLEDGTKKAIDECISIINDKTIK